MRNEIWLIALNRSVKYDDYQPYNVYNALFRLVYPTMTDPRGISMLGSVRKIFDACDLELDEMKTKIEQFKIGDGRKRYFEAPKNSYPSLKNSIPSLLVDSCCNFTLVGT